MRRLRILFWHRSLRALITLLLALLVGCTPPGKPDPANRPQMPDQNLSFDRLVASNCTGCHGTEGKLGPAPPLNDPLFVEIIPDDEILKVIRDGRLGTPMPPFSHASGGSLTDEQIKVLADGIKARWKAKQPFAPTPPEYANAVNRDAPASSDSRMRGAAIFERACAECHGASGKGNESKGQIDDALNAPAFLALISNQAIRRIIICGRPDLGMPNFSETDGRPDDFQPLTSAEIEDLVALIASWRATGNSVARTDP